MIVKEWSSGKAKSALTPELVPALCFREWTCPNLRRLWLGRASEDRSRRTRAFLACLRSDCPALLNPAQVPQHLLLMCCVLRYDGALRLCWQWFSVWCQWLHLTWLISYGVDQSALSSIDRKWTVVLCHWAQFLPKAFKGNGSIQSVISINIIVDMYSVYLLSQVYDAVAWRKDPAETWAGCLSGSGCFQPTLWTRSATGAQSEIPLHTSSLLDKHCYRLC